MRTSRPTKPALVPSGQQANACDGPAGTLVILNIFADREAAFTGSKSEQDPVAQCARHFQSSGLSTDGTAGRLA